MIDGFGDRHHNHVEEARQHFLIILGFGVIHLVTPFLFFQTVQQPCIQSMFPFSPSPVFVWLAQDWRKNGRVPTPLRHIIKLLTVGGPEILQYPLL
jgi:hypothetical protein